MCLVSVWTSPSLGTLTKPSDSSASWSSTRLVPCSASSTYTWIRTWGSFQSDDVALLSRVISSLLMFGANKIIYSEFRFYGKIRCHSLLRRSVEMELLPRDENFYFGVVVIGENFSQPHDVIGSSSWFNEGISHAWRLARWFQKQSPSPSWSSESSRLCTLNHYLQRTALRLSQELLSGTLWVLLLFISLARDLCTCSIGGVSRCQTENPWIGCSYNFERLNILL